MNILICDDIAAETKKLMELLDGSGADISAVAFQNSHDALDYFRSGVSVDCCFLDIVMPEMDGIELARELREAGFKGEIIFLSTSHEYGPETYTVDAFSYLLKPPTRESVGEVLRKLENARSRKDDDRDGITVNTKSFVRFILFRDISYAEVIKHKVYFRLVDGDEVDMYATFSEIAPQLLRNTRFVQCHNSFIVNMDAISAIDGKEIIMRNKARVPVSKSFSDIKSKYLDRITGGE